MLRFYKPEYKFCYVCSLADMHTSLKTGYMKICASLLSPAFNSQRESWCKGTKWQNTATVAWIKKEFIKH